MSSNSKLIAETQLGGHSDQTGPLDIPAGTTAQRPSPAQEGFARYNTDIGAIEIYYSGAWNKLSSGATGGADGSSSANAFVNLEDIVGLYDNGTYNLWTTIGGNTSAFQMPICFDHGGPWYVLSFNFPTYGFNETNLILLKVSSILFVQEDLVQKNVKSIVPSIEEEKLPLPVK